MHLQPTILYQDDAFIVVDKPSGMTVNRADTTKDEITLQDWVEKTYPFTKSENPPQKNTDGTYNPLYEFFSRGGIVHRLDKETSGSILIAKNVAMFVALQKQFKERTVKKMYIALVHGVLIPQEGEIAVPVGRLPFNRTRFGVIAGGREAVTAYKTVKQFSVKRGQGSEKLSLIEVFPKTGRTHQIRVHLKYLNHPILSDPLYAGRKVGRDDRKLLPRLFLHAASICFTHPMTEKEVSFLSPLPQELQDFISHLQPL